MKPTSTSLRIAALATARAYAATKGALALLGLAAICAYLLVPVPRESVLRHLLQLGGANLPADPFTINATTAAGAIQAIAGTEGEAAEQREQRALSESIAKRYRVAEQAVAGFVSLAYQAGAELKVDPLLVLAVMAVESRFNPVAESALGAKGLMQVIPKFHLEKLTVHGGEEALLEPEVNIYVGARILREYLRRFGETETALQMYAGAFDEPNSNYANKVLAERARLEIPRQKAKRQSSAEVNARPDGSA